jgi:CBS domain-containing protein
LTRKSRVFCGFCKRRLASQLDLSRQQLQATYAAKATAKHTMSTRLAELVRGAPLTRHPDETLRAAPERMQAARVGSILVAETWSGGAAASASTRLIGILTRTDLIGRVILPRLSLGTPVRCASATRC